MNRSIFAKAYSLLRASGSSYEAIVEPFWSEEDNGVVIPTIGKILPLKRPKEYELTWEESMKLAEESGMALPTMEELQHMRIWKDRINSLLKEHRGDLLEGYFWTCTEYYQGYACLVGFGSGSTGYNGKYNTYYCRPLAAFKF